MTTTPRSILPLFTRRRPHGTGALALVCVAILAIAGPSCDSGPPPIVVLGLDGLEWSMLRPMMERGELPNFARFVNEGASGTLRSEAPLLSPIIWTTIATGLSPDRHRVLDFTAPDPDGGSPIVITSLHRQCKAWWNILDESNVSTGTIGWWASWPAEILEHGFVVSDRIGYHAFIGEHRPDRSLVYPPALTETALEVLRAPETVTYAEAEPFLDVSEAEFESGGSLDFYDPVRHFRYIYANMENVERLAQTLYAEEHPRVLSVYFEGVDTAGHTYMRFTPPLHPSASPEEMARFGRTVEAFYRYQDEILGRLMKSIGEATYLIVSDHGFLTGSDRPARVTAGREFVEAPRWHHVDGVVMALGPGVTPGARIEASIRDVAPTVLALAGAPPSQDMTGRVIDEVVPADRRPASRVPTYESAAWLRERQTTLAESAFESEIMSRLTALGYIAADGSEASTSARSWVNLGSYHSGRGEKDEAREAYARALAVDPDNPQAHSNLGRLLAREGDLTAALPHLEAAFADDNGHLTVGYWLMRAHSAAGRHEDAIRVGETTLAANPGELSITVNLGVVYRLAGRPDDARRLFEAVLAEHPDNAVSWFHLGEIHRRRGDAPEAVRCYREAQRLDPGDQMTRRRLEAMGVDPNAVDAAGRP